MRTVFNVLLVLIILGLIYLLIESIREPIAFEQARKKRTERVIDRLKDIRTAQEMYRSITGEFAGTFDTLQKVLRTDSFARIKVEGDPDNPDKSKVIYDTTYSSAFDSVQTLEINLDSLPVVPYSDRDTFRIKADTITYQKTLTHVVEVGTPYETFMGPWADIKFSKYDKSYNPNAMLKFGSMNSPSTSGNWE